MDKKKIKFLLLLFILSNIHAYSQELFTKELHWKEKQELINELHGEMKSFVNDSTLFCNKCDSLYNRICPPNIFGHPQEFSKFPGDEKNLMKFLTENIKYPDECIEDSIQGRVHVKFIIDESGKIICPRILKSLHPAADQEALRIVQLMPDWKPASSNGVPCKMCYTFPALFTLNTTKANTNNKPNFFQRIFRKND